MSMLRIRTARQLAMLSVAVVFMFSTNSLIARASNPLRPQSNGSVVDRYRPKKPIRGNNGNAIHASAAVIAASTGPFGASVAASSPPLQSRTGARATIVQCCIIYGASYVSTKALQGLIPAELANLLRFVLAAIPFLPTMFKFRGDSRVILSGMELGVWCFLGFLTQAIALKITSASKVAFFGGLAVVMPAMVDLADDVVSARTKKQNEKRERKAIEEQRRKRQVITSLHAGKVDVNAQWLIAAAGTQCVEARQRSTVTSSSSNDGLSMSVLGVGDMNNNKPLNAEPMQKRIIRKKKSGKKRLPFLSPILAVLGAAVLEWGGAETPAMSDLFLLATPISFVSCFYKSEQLAAEFPDDLSVICGVMLSTVAILSSIWTIYSGNFPFSRSALMNIVQNMLMNWKILGLLLFNGVLATGWTIYSEQKALKVLSTAETTIIYSLEPLFASVFAAYFLHEQLEISMIFGAVFILAACMWEAVSDKPVEEMNMSTLVNSAANLGMQHVTQMRSLFAFPSRAGTDTSQQECSLLHLFTQQQRQQQQQQQQQQQLLQSRHVQYFSPVSAHPESESTHYTHQCDPNVPPCIMKAALQL